MSMKLITDAVDKLKVSAPVFQLNLTDSNWSGQRLEIDSSDPLNKVVNEPADNTFSALACKHFSEAFDHSSRRFKLDKERIISGVYKEIQSYLQQFLAQNHNSKVKNFAESKMGKWYYRHALNKDKSIPKNGLENNLVSLYNYLITNTGTDRSVEERHIKNGIAVMEAIMEKYYVEDDTRQRRRRRRRR